MSIFFKNGKKTFWLEWLRWHVLLFVYLHGKNLALMLSSACSICDSKNIWITWHSSFGFLVFIYWLFFIFLEFYFIRKQDLCLTWSATVYKCVERACSSNKEQTYSKLILFHLYIIFVKHLCHRNSSWKQRILLLILLCLYFRVSLFFNHFSIYLRVQCVFSSEIIFYLFI